MFDWLLRGEKQEPNIFVKKEFCPDGVKFIIFKEEEDKRTKLTFPIPYSKYFDLRDLVKKDFYLSLQILEDLWNGGDLIELEEGTYLINPKTIYDFQEELVELLGFENDEKLKVELKANLPVGTRNFSLNYKLYHPEYGYISNFYTRQGVFFPVDDEKAILLKPELVNLFKLIENPPKSKEEQLPYVAKVKSLGMKLDVQFDNYLTKEHYLFPEELDVDIKTKALDHIELQPKFNDLSQQLNNETQKWIEQGSNYAVAEENKKKVRIFFDSNKKRDYQQILNNKELRGPDVPRFVENPAAFLPESIDLSRFSDRVKGLKEHIYKAQPYVKGKANGGMDWFELDVGIGLKRDEEAEVKFDGGSEEKVGDNIDIEQFKNLVKEAQANNTEYVMWNGNWIKIPADSQEFIQGTEKVSGLLEQGKISKKRLPYVFDIFDNVERLEYDLTLLNQKRILEEKKKLTYLKPRLFNGTLYNYQEDGFLWLNRLEIASLGGLLADDMGLGKTVQIIAFMAYLKEKRQLTPSLIIAPASLLKNWYFEIRKFCPAITKIYIHRGSDRFRDSNSISEAEVVITTYQTLVRDQIILGEIDWQLLVCDEAQNIKNQTTLASHAVKAQKAKLRLALTGTPVENCLSDLWSIVDYAQPGLLDSFKRFKKEFIEPIENNQVVEEELRRYEEKLVAKIYPIYLRRTKEDELKEELPGKFEHENKIEMSKTQEKLYNQVRMEYKKSGGKYILKALQQLLFVCSHPGLVTKEWKFKSVEELISEGPKLEILINILTEIYKQREKAIIFTLYREMQYIIQRVVREKFNLDWIPIINGGSRQRLETVEKFNNEPGFGCMLLSPRAAGTGLNIVGANHVIHYTRWWNPAVEQQATDRAYRIGQKKDVHVYYPIIVSSKMETVEEKLNRLLKEKRRLARSIIIPNKRIEGEIIEELSKTI